MSGDELFHVIKVKEKVISDSLIKEKLLDDVVIKHAQLNIWNVDKKITWVNWRLIAEIKSQLKKKLWIRSWNEETVIYCFNKIFNAR